MGEQQVQREKLANDIFKATALIYSSFSDGTEKTPQ